MSLSASRCFRPWIHGAAAVPAMAAWSSVQLGRSLHPPAGAGSPHPQRAGGGERGAGN